MRPIAIFYHCLFQIRDFILEPALEIVHEQMVSLENSGLLDRAKIMVVGVNGGDESRVYAESLLPSKAEVIYHGLRCRNENRTIYEMEKWVAKNPDHNVLYFHAKGSTHPDGMDDDGLRCRWRRCMMKACVFRWRECVYSLDRGYDAVGAHWMIGQGTDFSQNYFAGTFFWATSNFLATLPSIYSRDRIKKSGIDSHASRYEAEVWIGNGENLPRVRDLVNHQVQCCP